jgi:transposase
VHGARSVIANLKNKQNKVSCWIRQLVERRGYLRAIVAVVARNARMIWTLLLIRQRRISDTILG